MIAIIRLLLLAMLTLPVCGQDSIRKTFYYYPSGSVAAERLDGNDSSCVIKRYYPSGILEAVAQFKGQRQCGVQKSYYPTGELMFIHQFGERPDSYTFTNFFKDGSVALSGAYRKAKKFGFWCKYKENGKLAARTDFNKGKVAMVRDRYRTDRHLKQLPMYGRMKRHKKVILVDGTGHTRKLKRSALAYLKFNGSDTVYRHCLISGFMGDSLVISKFSYDLSDGPYSLKLDSVFFTPLSSVKEINHLKYNGDAKYSLGFTLYVVGTLVCLEFLIEVPIIFGVAAFTMPSTYVGASVSLAAAIVGLKLNNRLSRKSYTILSYR